MSTVFLDGEVLPVTTGETIPVPVLVLRVDGELFFERNERKGLYVIEPERIILKGGTSGPQGFKLLFTLAEPVVKEGYVFADPALLFSQAGSRQVGFFFSPEGSGTEAMAAVFNGLVAGDPLMSDSFALQLTHPVRGLLIHDPTIVWDPPGGG